MPFSVAAGSWFAGREVISGSKKHSAIETLKLTVPAHRPVKRTTLAHILKQANLSVDDFLRLV